MSITKRIVRLVKSDINELLDCLEDPQAILSQAVREMEEELIAARRQLESLILDEERLSAALNQLDEFQRENSNRIDLCFESENDELAKTFVRKRLEFERRRRPLEQALDENKKSQSQLGSRIREQEEKLHSVQEKRELFTSRDRTPGGSKNECEWTVSEEQVELAMLEERKRRAAGNNERFSQ